MGVQESVDIIQFGEVLDGPAEPSELDFFVVKNIPKNRKLGVDYGRLSYSQAKRLADEFGPFVDISDELEKIKSTKDEQEIRDITRSIAITEAAHARAKRMISEGVTEREISACAVNTLLQNGADWFSFSPLVASGKRSAYPHGAPTMKSS